MGRRHIVRKADRNKDLYDFGTPERARQGTGLVRDTRLMAGDGKPAPRQGMRAYAECALDALLLNGALGDGEVASRRHKAGEWLRSLYVLTHPTRSAMRWETGGRDQAEMSDRTAWNLKCLSDTFRVLGRYRAVVEAVCCDDRAVADVATLQQGLDLLADNRGL
jgi:hypothetical protein